MDEQKTVARLITIAVYEGNDYTVAEGERSADRLCWDEMIAQVIQLTAPNPPRLYPMRTDAEHAEQRAIHEARMARLQAKRDEANAHD